MAINLQKVTLEKQGDTHTIDLSKKTPDLKAQYQNLGTRQKVWII